MRSTSWPQVGVLVEAAGAGWTGLWSLLFTAERAVGALGQAVSFAEAMDLMWLGEELRAACDDVAVAHPGEVAVAEVFDLGPLTGSEDAQAARVVVARLLSVVICRGDELLVGPHTEHDARLLTGLTSSLFAARSHLVGGRW